MPLDGTDYGLPAISDADRQAADLLRRARALIERPENWCQGITSRSTAYGASFCMMGALDEAGKEYNIELTPIGYACRLALLEATASMSVSRWNDNPRRSHAEVLAAFDRAIALCEGGK